VQARAKQCVITVPPNISGALRKKDVDQQAYKPAAEGPADGGHQRGNAAERLGFLRRIIHGHNPRAWLKELKGCLGESVDCAKAFG
jgi:hypothetical protein